jgi:hypothetical protein
MGRRSSGGRYFRNVHRALFQIGLWWREWHRPPGKPARVLREFPARIRPASDDALCPAGPRIAAWDHRLSPPHRRPRTLFQPAVQPALASHLRMAVVQHGIAGHGRRSGNSARSHFQHVIARHDSSLADGFQQFLGITEGAGAGHGDRGHAAVRVMNDDGMVKHALTGAKNLHWFRRR